MPIGSPVDTFNAPAVRRTHENSRFTVTPFSRKDADSERLGSGGARPPLPAIEERHDDDSQSTGSLFIGWVFEGLAETNPALRQRMAARASRGPAIETPYDDLARQIGEAAYRRTAAQVASVLAGVASEKAAFQLIAAAATGAGLLRWQQAIKALEQAGDAPA